jgi:hypothetical protein
MANPQPVPPSVEQIWEDSCWAAVLESWSLADPRLSLSSQAGSTAPEVIEQEELANAWGEGSTKKIVPSKLEEICSALSLRWRVCTVSNFQSYVELYLPQSHLLCAYTRNGDQRHAVLIYKCDGDGATYMDPVQLDVVHQPGRPDHAPSPVAPRRE